ncbi:MAG: NADH-quinone oxidoreductase subunit NuoG [Gammaproteobacteria bacterium]
MPTIYIDDEAYEVPEGDNVLQACLSAGIDLPYFCWHPAMGSVGACRQCALVQYRDEEDTRGRIVMGCMTPVTDGARFSMQGDTASEFRESIIESLMLNHPHDCPVCAEGGECHLQDMTVMVGHRDRRYRGRKNTHRNQYLGPLVHHEMNRCISCYRCTRFYNDYAGGTDLSAQGAHDHVYFGRQKDGVLESEFAGNLVEVCPTGVFTDKPLVQEYTRKWDLQSAPSVCTGCALGCNTMPGERYGKLKRVHNRFNSQVNGYFLCDRGRYGGSFVNDEKRAPYPALRNADGRYDAIESSDAMHTLKEWCGAEKRLAAVGSPRASLESNYLLRRLVGENNYSNGMADYEAALVEQIASLLANVNLSTPSMKQVESADSVLILGEDVTNTAPRLALALRQSVRNRALQMAAELNIPHWQDEAVRVLAQDQLSPLFIVAMSDTRLDDVAQATLSLSPPEIARLGFAIAAELDTSLPSVSGLDQQTQQRVTEIADSLKNAERPLIVSGTGCQSPEVVQAAAMIATALNNGNAMLSYCLPEANSLGSAMLSNGNEASLQDLCRRAEDGGIDTLIVMENDLYRRAPRQQVDSLLNNVTHLVVLDSNDNPTVSKSSLALPSATFAEAEGTLVSSEGRAQRHYPVFLPAEQRQASWLWLNQLGQSLNLAGFKGYQHFDQVTEACAAAFPALSEIDKASPSADFRNRGLKIPRQTHRYSGRTAMLADISLHEPKQPVDKDSPLAFTMEGANGSQSGALLPFVWSPGWNSNQSLHKFQAEAGGALAGGTAGIRLIEPAAHTAIADNVRSPSAFTAATGQLLLTPLYRIFGSEELSALSPAVAELVDRPFIQLTPEDAAQFNVSAGDDVAFSLADEKISAEVHINPAIPAGCAGYSVGLPGASWLPPGSVVALSKDESLIAAEKGGADV